MDNTQNEVKTETAIDYCRYCGKKRPVTELKLTKIYHNGGRVENLYCADDKCAIYAEMSGEG